MADLTEGRWARVFRGLADRGCVLIIIIISPPPPAAATPPRRQPCWPWSYRSHHVTESEFAAPVADLTEGRSARVFRGLVDRGCVLTIINPPRPTPLPPPPRPPLSQGDHSVGRGATDVT